MNVTFEVLQFLVYRTQSMNKKPATLVVVTRINIDGTGEVLAEVPNKGKNRIDTFGLKQLQEWIGGGYIENCPCFTKNMTIIADEDGRAKGFPVNKMASQMAGYTERGSNLVGPVLFIQKI